MVHRVIMVLLGLPVMVYASLGVASENTHLAAVPAVADIRALGLQARLEPERRDALLQKLAGWIESAVTKDKAALHARQSAVQEALLLATDDEIYRTLAPETIDAIDNALEKVFDLDEIARSTYWEPLIYVYGFYNRDVTAAQIAGARDTWDRMPARERERLQPTYPHTLDALCKPLTMGSLHTPEETREALGIVVPLMKTQLLQPAAPGRAFHPPSHAALVIGPLFERWNGDPDAGALVRTHIPSRDRLIQMLSSRLLGAQPEVADLKEFELKFHTYVGRYVANALARLNARSTLPTLQKTLDIYQRRGIDDPAAAYTRRALIALGDADARKRLESALDTASERPHNLAVVVWLCRNGKDETKHYGARILAKLLECDPDEALDRYFRQALHRIEKP